MLAHYEYYSSFFWFQNVLHNLGINHLIFYTSQYQVFEDFFDGLTDLSLERSSSNDEKLSL